MRKPGVFALALALLVGTSAMAGTITSIDPPEFPVTTSEEFITIYGTSLGDVVRFVGGGATFDVPINANVTGGVVSWVPTRVLAVAGNYSVYVLDGRGGSSGPATLKIIGTTKPKLTLHLPDVILAPAKSREGAYVKFNVSVIGTEDPEPVVKCDPESGALFKLGATTVRCEAYDRYGDRDSGEFSVTVFDGASPIVTVPKSFEVEAEGPEGAIVKFDASAIDDLDGGLVPVCSPASGSQFPVGLTRVACTAVDSWGNAGSGVFDVNVRYSRLVIHVPTAVVAEAENEKGANVEFTVTATSPDDPNPEVKCDPESGSFFEMGTTVVKCVASDRFGGTAEGAFELTVNDTVGPFIASIAARPDYLAPTGEMTLVKVELDAFDLVDAAPRCSIVDVTANEPIDGEWRVAGDLEVYLNAKYSGKVDRIYSINVTCTDETKNESSASANVIVADKPPQNLGTALPTRKSRKH